jgi:hypothetical protein
MIRNQNMLSQTSVEICGKSAVDYLKSHITDLDAFKKDNTDKLWSYKSKGRGNREFAFDPKTTTKLSVWVDLEAAHLENLSFVEVIQSPLTGRSTALDRVFSGGIHTARTKLRINSEEDLGSFIRWLRDIPVLIKNK